MIINKHLDNGLIGDTLVHYVNRSDICFFFHHVHHHQGNERRLRSSCAKKVSSLSLGDADGRRQKSRDGHCARDCFDAIGSRFFRDRGSSARPSAVAVDTVDRFDSLSVRLGFQSQLSAFEKKIIVLLKTNRTSSWRKRPSR